MKSLGPYAVRGIIGILIIVAVGIFLARVRRESAPQNPSVGALDISAVLSGTRHHSTSAAFQGGKVSAFMGGVDLDLRNATIEGDEAILEIFACMGGISIRVPATWTVESEARAIFGGIENGSVPAQGGKRLVLRGRVYMGGLDIRN